jgi:hypothetical protein
VHWLAVKSSNELFPYFIQSPSSQVVDMGVLGCIAATYKAKLVGTCAKGKGHHSTSPEDFHMDKDTGLSGLSHLDTARHEACFSTRKNT